MSELSKTSCAGQHTRTAATPCTHYYPSPSLGVEVILSHLPQIKYPLHSHISTWVIALIKAGRCTLRTKNRDYIRAQGETYTLAPNEAHAIIVEDFCDAITLCVNASLVQNGSAHRHTTILLGAMIRGGILPPEDAALVESIITELPRAEPPLSNAPLSENRALILKLKNEIEIRPERELSLKQMSAMTHLSPYHLLRTFKSVVGLTPHQFQRQNRARLARGLIAKGGHIADAAARSGFYDQSHLCRCFKELTGMTPKDYALSYTELNPPL